MIVRILTDNQYRLDERHATQLDALDDELLDAMDADDEGRFGTVLARLVALVQDNGQLVGMEEVIPSEVIIPAPDMSLGEAQTLLQQAEVKFTPRAGGTTDPQT